MRNRLAQSVLEAKDNEESLPLEHAYAAGIEATIQVIDTQKIQNLLGIASSVEGRQGIATPPSQKKHLSKIDRHVNVAFGSRMPLPLSTVQINTNFPHDIDGLAAYNSQASRLTNVTETQATIETLKVSEPKACPPQTKVFSSGTEKQPKLKALNPKTFHNVMPQNLCESASFPVQEELHVDNLETNPVLIDRCLDLTSKHGQKLQKLNRRKEVKIHKRNHFIRHAQKENCSQSKLREQKELNVKESPPGSPPSGWDNNSDEGSDSFLFGQHFEELPKSTSRGTLPHCYPISHPFDDTCNHNQGSQTLSENGCIVSEGDSYFEKNISCTAKGGLPPSLYQQDHSRIHQSSNTTSTEKDLPHEVEKDCSYDQELGSQAFKSQFFGSADGLKTEIAKPAEHVLTSKLQEAGGLLQHNGPFGSTEELWIVHEEGDFGDPISSLLSNGPNERALQLEESRMKESEVQQLRTYTTTNLIVPKTTAQPNLCCITNTSATRNDIEVKPANYLDLKKPLPSKLEDKELDLLYDPILDCYYDPKTNRYYELK